MGALSRTLWVFFCFFVYSTAWAQTLPPEVVAGRTWLLAQVQSDGSLQSQASTMATAQQTRAEVLDTLHRLQVAPSSLLNKVRAEQSDQMVEHIARHVLATLAAGGTYETTRLDAMKRWQNADGGFAGTGLSEGAPQSSILDTAFAVLALRATNESGATIQRAVNYLIAQLSLPSQAHTQSSQPYVDAYLLLALQSASAQLQISSSLELAKLRLLAHREQGIYRETLLDVIAAIALANEAQGNPDLLALRSQIKNSQLANGSWENDSFLTALALRALHVQLPVAPPTTGEIHARIIDSQSRLPISGARFELNPRPELSTTSAADGRIRLATVPADSYAVELSRVGYQLRLLPGIAVSANGITNMGDVELLRLPTTSVLRGVITDARDQSPVAGASIVLTGAVQETLTSGPDGRYEWVGTQAGNIEISVTKSGFQSAQGSGALVLGSVLSFSPVLYPTAAVVPNSSALFGRVASSTTGLPLAQVRVQIGAREVESDIEGRFELLDLTPGAITASLTKQGYLPVELSATLARGANDVGLIVLQPEPTQTTPTSRLTGRVLDASNGTALMGVRVEIVGSNRSTLSTVDGRYEINQITTTPFQVRFSLPGYGTQNGEIASSVHGNFTLDANMGRLVGASSIVLESVVLNASEYDPHTEVGLIGRLRNTGTVEAGVVNTVIVRDAQGSIIRELRAFYQDPSGDTAEILQIPAGEMREVRVNWNTDNDASGAYTATLVARRGFGAVEVEGQTQYQVLSVTKLGGSVDANPPLLQAGLNLPVQLRGTLTNMGNQPIPSTPGELTITLVRADNQAPLPGPPTATGRAITGNALSDAQSIALDSAGNMYFTKAQNQTLYKADTSNVVSIVLSHPAIGFGSKLAYHPDGYLHIASGTQVLRVNLSNTAQISLLPNPVGFPRDYEIDAAGNEYFTGNYQLKDVLLKRNSAGALEVLLEGGSRFFYQASVGPDQNVYMASSDSLIKLHTDTGRWERLESVPQTRAIAVAGNGDIYYAEYAGTIRKRTPSGTVTTFATGFPKINALRFDAEGRLYALQPDSGRLMQFETDGSSSVLAQTFMQSAFFLAIDGQGRYFAGDNQGVRRRDPDGSVHSVYSSSSLTALQAGSDGTLNIAERTALKRLVGTQVSTVYQNANAQIDALAMADDGAPWFAGRISGQLGIYRFAGQPSLQLPIMNGTPQHFILSQNRAIVATATEVLAFERDGSQQRIGAGFSNITSMAALGADHVVYDDTLGFVKLLPNMQRQALHPILSGFGNAFALEPAGKAVVYRVSAASVQRLDFASGQAQTISASLPHAVQKLFVDRFGSIWILGASRLSYWNGTSWSTIATQATEAGLAFDESLFVVDAGKLYSVDGAAALALQRASVPQTTRLLPLANQELAAFESSENAVAYHSTQIERYYYLPSTRFLTWSDGSLYAGDTFTAYRVQGTRVQKWAEVPSGSLTSLASDGATVYLSNSSAIYQAGTQGAPPTQAFALAKLRNNYGLFAIRSGVVLAKHASTNEIIAYDASRVLANYMPLTRATDVLPLGAGKFWITDSVGLVELQASTQQLELIASTTTDDRLGSLARAADGAVYSTEGTTLVRIAPDGSFEPLAAPLRRNVTALSGVLMIRDQPYGYDPLLSRFYQREGVHLNLAYAKVADPGQISFDSEGQAVVVDANGGYISRIENGIPHVLTDGYFGVHDFRITGADEFALSYNNGLVIGNFPDRWRVVDTANSVFAIAVTPNRKLWTLATTTPRTATEYQLAAAVPDIAEGTVLHRQALQLPALGTEGVEHLALGSWTPPVGGDYEFRIAPLAATPEGYALGGLRVGPAASARISANKSELRPDREQVEVNLYAEGGDFTSIARVLPGQMEMLANNFTELPKALGIDASGGLWALMFTELRYYKNGSYITIDQDIRQFGDVPVDNQQRAYGFAFRFTPQGAKHQLMRYSNNGQSELLTSLPTGIPIGMVLDPVHNDLYVLTRNGYAILKYSAEGVWSTHVDLSRYTSMNAMTRDAAGNIYLVSGHNLLRINRDGSITNLLEGEGVLFENEGATAAGTCANGVYISGSLPQGGQFTEEAYLMEFNASTGNVGQVFSGRALNRGFTDMDFVIYDRFNSKLVIYNENLLVGVVRSIFSVPITCGAVDANVHLVFPPGQVHQGFTPEPSQTISRADGSKELVWNLKDVTASGRSIRFGTELANLQRGSERPVLKDAYFEFRNTFGGPAVRQAIDIPKLRVVDYFELRASTDRTSYQANQDVLGKVLVSNLDLQQREGRLVIDIVDANDALVRNLLDRPERIPAQETRSFEPPFNTGAQRAGGYALRARVLGPDGSVWAQAKAEFTIKTDNTSATIPNHTVSTDQRNYQPNARVTITAEVSNPFRNTDFRNLSVHERVLSPSGSVLFEAQQPIANLEPQAVVQREFELALQQAAVGNYQVEQSLKDSLGQTLSQATTSFSVQAEPGAQALSGVLNVTPVEAARGTPVQLSASVSNRGNSALLNLPVQLKVLDLNAGKITELASFPFQIDLSVGATVPVNATFTSTTIAPGSYVVVLSATTLEGERVLAQKTFRVLAVELSGSLQATPAQATRSDIISLSASVQNRGNITADAVPLKLRVEALSNGSLVREWSYTQSLAVQQSFNASETLAASSIPIGSYRASWIATLDGQNLTLAQSEFTVVAAQLSGSLQIAPNSVTVGQNVSLNALVLNTGNAAAQNQAVRLQVLRADTQVEIQTWNEQSTIAANAQYALNRSLSTTGFAAGTYTGVLMLLIDGSWQGVATEQFDVTQAAIDVQMQMQVQRDARILVLASCSPSQQARTESEALAEAVAAGRAATPEELPDSASSTCDLQRKAFIEQFLTARAIPHKVVLDGDEFTNEMRCGNYNVYWLSNGASKLSQADSKELREVIFRGDGLLVDGAHDQRNNLIDSIAGFSFQGGHAQDDQVLIGEGSLFPAVSVPTYGRALRLTTSTGTVRASFVQAKTPAAISHSFGQGKTLTFAFDLTEVLNRDGSLPASTRLFDNAIVHISPSVLAQDYARGSYVPVTTTVENRGQAVDLRLQTQVSAPDTIEASRPLPTVGDGTQSTWDFQMTPSSVRTFDVGVRTANEAQTGVQSQLLRREAGNLLSPLSNLSVSLPLRDLVQHATTLEVAMAAAKLQGGEAAALRRALNSIQAARTAQQANDAEQAITRWIDATLELDHISSVSTSAWRLAIAQLLEISQRSACGAGAGSVCGLPSSPSAPIELSNQALFAANASLERLEVRGGRPGNADWEVGLGVNTQSTPQMVNGHITWDSKKVFRYVLNYAGNGSGRIQVYDGATLVLDRNYVPTAGATGLRTGNALQLYVKSSANINNAKVSITLDKLNNIPMTGALSTRGDNTFSEARLSYYYPPMQQSFVAEGTMSLTYTGTVPTGSRLNFMINSGSLQCNRAASSAVSGKASPLVDSAENN